MADYYPVISKAVAGLENQTVEARRSLYERARTALTAQLRSIVPALPEGDITRERVALEEAIRSVETKLSAARVQRSRLSAEAVALTPPIFPAPSPAVERRSSLSAIVDRPPKPAALPLLDDDEEVVEAPRPLLDDDEDVEPKAPAPRLRAPAPARLARAPGETAFAELARVAPEQADAVAPWEAFRVADEPPSHTAEPARRAPTESDSSAINESYVWKRRHAGVAALLLLVPIVLSAVWFALASGLGIAGLSRAWPLALIVADSPCAEVGHALSTLRHQAAQEEPIRRRSNQIALAEPAGLSRDFAASASKIRSVPR